MITIMLFTLLFLVAKVSSDVDVRPYLMVEKAGEKYVSKSVYLTPMKCPANESENETMELKSCLKDKEKLQEIVDEANRTCDILINETLSKVIRTCMFFI